MVEESKYVDEILTDEELDAVSGGTMDEAAEDSRFFNKLNGSCKRYSRSDLAWSGSKCNDVKRAWNAVGVEFIIPDDTYDIKKIFTSSMVEK